MFSHLIHLRKPSTVRHLEEEKEEKGMCWIQSKVMSSSAMQIYYEIVVIQQILHVCRISRSSGYLEQCGCGGVEFRVAVHHSIHSWRIIANN